MSQSVHDDADWQLWMEARVDRLERQMMWMQYGGVVLAVFALLGFLAAVW